MKENGVFHHLAKFGPSSEKSGPGLKTIAARRMPGRSVTLNVPVHLINRAQKVKLDILHNFGSQLLSW